MLLVSNATEAVAAQLAATRNTDACISCHVDSCLPCDSCLCEAAAEHGRVLPGSHVFAPVAFLTLPQAQPAAQQLHLLGPLTCSKVQPRWTQTPAACTASTTVS